MIRDAFNGLNAFSAKNITVRNVRMENMGSQFIAGEYGSYFTVEDSRFIRAYHGGVNVPNNLTFRNRCSKISAVTSTRRSTRSKASPL
jgi:hypothetical protein